MEQDPNQCLADAEMDLLKCLPSFRSQSLAACVCFEEYCYDRSWCLYPLVMRGFWNRRAVNRQSREREHRSCLEFMNDVTHNACDPATK